MNNYISENYSKMIENHIVFVDLAKLMGTECLEKVLREGGWLAERDIDYSFLDSVDANNDEIIIDFDISEYIKESEII